MDDVSRYNKERWEELAKGNVRFSRPWLDLDGESARAALDPHDIMGDVAGKDVLCLAGGGGQQSAAFAVLGANVIVLDFSETQLERDQQAADHYGLSIKTVQGDMRELSCFPDDSFHIVWHAHSLNFVPDPRPVFDEVARVIRVGGPYRMECTNPFIHELLGNEWDERGYSLRSPYLDGAEIVYDDPYWETEDGAGGRKRVRGPREFRHALSTIINGLVNRNFAILGLWESNHGDLEAEPGSWDHLTAIAPPWLTFWTLYRPNQSCPSGASGRIGPSSPT